MNDDGVPPMATLAGRTLASLHDYFDCQGHRPSAAHWAALEDIATTLEDMADWACPTKVFLSAVDPGIGKSQTVAHFAKAIASADNYSDVGMIVAAGRIAECVAMAETLLSLGVPKGRFAVFTSDPAANAMGHEVVNNAQVLITTQQRIELDCDRGRKFDGASRLFYRGRPRDVRAWDEAYLPGLAVTLNRHDLYGLVRPVEHVSPDFAAGIAGFADHIGALEHGAAVVVPDWEADFGVCRYKVADAMADHREDEKRTCRGLLEIGGRRARVVRENSHATTMLTYRDTLPADLAPMIVLDASVRVREIYEVMTEHRGNLEHLTPATKDYSPMKVHVWQTSGSKTGFKRDHDKLVKGIVEVIQTKPAERWLVVVHKPSRKVADVDRAIRQGLPAEVAANVSTLPWGQHMATNAYADHANVILAGTLFTKPAHHLALAHMAQDRDLGMGFVSPAEVAKVEQGEHAHMILQALCRGRVRKSDGDRCFPMNAYIIAATRHGVPHAVTTIFPGAAVDVWDPDGRTLRGRLAEAMALVDDALNADGQGWVAYGTIRTALNMDRSNFRRNVLNHPDWRAAIADRPYCEMGVGLGGRSLGLSRVDRQEVAQAA